MKEKKLLRVAKYIRVSTDRQAKDGDSLRDQDETLTDHINRSDNMILAGTFVDDGVSGQKINRDDFSRLIQCVKNEKIDLIIFTKLDRWFRSLRHYLNTQTILEKHNVSWLAVSQPYFDTSTAHGRAFVQQSMSWAELEAQNGSERILSVFENKVKNSEVISGTTPLGYKIVDKHLIPNEDAEKAKKIFEFYKREPNLRAVMRYASEEFGFVRTHSTFKRMIQNTKYKGVYRDNDNYCPPIVSEELWDECNRLLSRNQRANKKHDYVFTGLLVCGDCGHKLSACTMKKRDSRRKQFKTETNPSGSDIYRYPAYRCPWRINGHNCINSKQYYEKTLEKRMLDRVKTELKMYIHSMEAKAAPAIDYSAKRKSIEKKITKLKELYINELISLDEFKTDRAYYEQKIDEIPKVMPQKKDLRLLYNILDMDLDKLYPQMGVKEKNLFWRSFVDEIRIDNDHKMIIKFL